MDASSAKHDAEEDVYEHVRGAVENVQDYVPGGLHPVYLGDTVNDGRYKVLRKLGYGGYSTVWLAQDNHKRGSFVALKIMRSDKGQSKELQSYDALRVNKNQHPGLSSIMLLKDCFSINGVNGDHGCFAYEVMGPSIARVREDYCRPGKDAYLTLSCARKIVYQVLTGLDYMHSIGLAHGDLYADNVLFTIRDLSDEPIDSLRQSHNQITEDVRRIKGERRPEDPRHLTLIRPLNDLVSPSCRVKISDLGNSFFENDPPAKIETPPEIRSPEIMAGGHVSIAQDCWALGCLIYNVLTNRHPFDLGFVYNEQSRKDAYLIQISSLLGPLPAKIKNNWPRYGEYFDNTGNLIKFEVDDDTYSYPDLEGVPEGDYNSSVSDAASEAPTDTFHDQAEQYEGLFNPELYPCMLKIFDRKRQRSQSVLDSLADFTALYPPLGERWLDEKHPDMESEESAIVLDLLRGLFTYSPEQRLSTKDILEHAWIRDYCIQGDECDKRPEQTTDAPARKRKRASTDERTLEDRRKIH